MDRTDKNKPTLKAKMKKILSLLIRKRDTYELLSNEEYLKSFGFIKNYGETPNLDMLKKAYEKAWDNRDFEINKFWTRAAYFWGFIVLIFGGFITLLTSSENELAIAMRLDLYLVALGLVFSIAWYLVILGSKSWQENWEEHIDHLEDYVSGPIYKMIYYKGKRFYSVSKINEILALIVIVVWLSLFAQYFSKNFTIVSDWDKLDVQATLTLIFTIIFSIALRFGYSLGSYKATKDGFFHRWSDPNQTDLKEDELNDEDSKIK